ncbi:MAG: hypothetical protein QOI38_2279 [Sphingomonadales bacterium]|jgi:hypothetical protein|nr:hypothetical protein [Sphingomonadales bacterium]
MLYRLLAALALAAVAPSAYAEPVQADQADRTAIEFALSRGQLLYALDRAAWVATDDMNAQFPGWPTAGVRGYVVEREGAGFAVTFYGGAENAPVAFYRGRVEAHRIVSRDVFPAGARPPLTAGQRRLVAARDAAARSTRWRPCGSAPFNSAVIPPATADGPIDVYLLTPQTSDAIPLGGHYRATVAADGTVSGERGFMNSCMEMPGAPSGAEAFVVSHLLDPVPTEIHVFSSLAARTPIYVAIARPERLYAVTGDRIRLVDRGARRRRD